MPPAAAPAPSNPPQQAREVCTQAAIAWLSPDTRTDSDPSAARLRAAERWGTPALQATTASAPPARPTSEWREWNAHHARISAHAVPYIGDAPPPADHGRHYAAVQIARTAIGTGGWQQQLPEVTAYCTTSTEHGSVLVDQLQITQAGQP
ncbi:hypothetical protein [Saccharopolyspora griseoalba]|uniref:SCP domain-containing protein n=1 Tax=Saccharopolyspora griseoalba TaxID=1431848 RepID=A0ABW2LWD0_9PSEU